MKTNKSTKTSKAGLPSVPSNSSKDSGQNTTPALDAQKAVTQPAWRGIFFRGPNPVRNREGDESPTWLVYLGNEEGEPVGTVYRCFSFERSEKLAQSMSHDRRLELVNEAHPAIALAIHAAAMAASAA